MSNSTTIPNYQVNNHVNSKYNQDFSSFYLNNLNYHRKKINTIKKRIELLNYIIMNQEISNITKIEWKNENPLIVHTGNYLNHDPGEFFIINFQNYENNYQKNPEKGKKILNLALELTNQITNKVDANSFSIDGFYEISIYYRDLHRSLKAYL